MDNIVISVLGNRNSGKSTTWNELFGRTVRTGSEIRRLYLNQNEYVEVFLMSGTPEERETYIGDIERDQRPRIILCSLQYRRDVTKTIDFFLENNYSLYGQWLNPGYSEPQGIQMFDRLGIFNYLVANNSTITIQDGKKDPNRRVQLIREFIYGWAEYRNLIESD
jgi:hypothetical protein